MLQVEAEGQQRGAAGSDQRQQAARLVEKGGQEFQGFPLAAEAA